MSKRYSTVNTLGAQTPMPLLGWLTRELDINNHDLRSVSAYGVRKSGEGARVLSLDANANHM